MTKQQKQTRKRAHQTNGASSASGKNVKQSRPQTRDREGSKSGVNYLRVCVGVLCVACTVVLLWNMPSFHSGDHSTQQNVAQKGESHETNPPRKHSKRNKKGIKDIYVIVLNSVY